MSALIHTVGDALARGTSMTPAQARGTLRLLLKESGVDPSIARKADVLALVGPKLDEALAKRHIVPVPGALAILRRAVENAEEHEDALDLFGDIE